MKFDHSSDVYFYMDVPNEFDIVSFDIFNPENKKLQIMKVTH